MFLFVASKTTVSCLGKSLKCLNNGKDDNRRILSSPLAEPLNSNMHVCVFVAVEYAITLRVSPVLAMEYPNAPFIS